MSAVRAMTAGAMRAAVSAVRAMAVRMGAMLSANLFSRFALIIHFLRIDRTAKLGFASLNLLLVFLF